MIASEIDCFLRERIYLPISQFAGRNFGSTAGSLSRACLLPMVVANTIGHLLANNYVNTILLIQVLAFIVILTLATLFWLQSWLADFIPNRSAFYMMGPIFRLYWAIWIAIGAIEFIISWKLYRIAFTVDDIFTTSAVYFQCVPPPPPKKRKKEVYLSDAVTNAA